MSLAEAFAPAEADYKNRVMVATWGHLASEKNRTYRGHMVFCHAGYGGNICVIDAEWDDLPDSPWLCEAMLDFASEHSPEPGVYRFDGTVRNYHFKGTVKKVQVEK